MRSHTTTSSQKRKSRSRAIVKRKGVADSSMYCVISVYVRRLLLPLSTYVAVAHFVIFNCYKSKGALQ